MKHLLPVSTLICSSASSSTPKAWAGFESPIPVNHDTGNAKAAAAGKKAGDSRGSLRDPTLVRGANHDNHPSNTGQPARRPNEQATATDSQSGSDNLNWRPRWRRPNLDDDVDQRFRTQQIDQGIANCLALWPVWMLPMSRRFSRHDMLDDEFTSRNTLATEPRFSAVPHRRWPSKGDGVRDGGPTNRIVRRFVEHQRQPEQLQARFASRAVVPCWHAELVSSANLIVRRACSNAATRG